MNVLIIKTSSLGDVLHTLPALTDAGNALPNIKFDWVVEEAFAEIPAWHPLVEQVIPVAIRRWRKTPMKSLFSTEWKNFRQKIRGKKYDMVIDAQGLIKSALITRLCRGCRVGLDKKSLTEPLARFAYQKTVSVDLQKHAVFRMRSIFAQALNYTLPDTISDSGIPKQQFIQNISTNNKALLFAHGTTWPSKHWPDEHWTQLATLAAQNGYNIRLPWGNEKERARAEKIAQSCNEAHIIPHTNLSGIATEIAQACAVVSVDSGIAHLAATLGTKSLTLYGPTNPDRIGTTGKQQYHLLSDFECTLCDKTTCAYAKENNLNSETVCLENLSPKKVWETLYDTHLT